VPFKGRNEYDLTSAILRAPVQPFSPHVPPILRSIILRCLAKEPAQRYQQAGEVRAALEAIQSDVAMMPPVVLHDVPAVSKRMAVAAGGALLLIAGIATWVWWGGRRGPWERTAAEGLLTRIVSTQDQTTDPALSPDGGMVAYVVETHDGRVDLYVGRVRGGARVRLTDDEALEGSPRFSPDGERIAFSRRSSSGLEIRVIPALGGDVSATGLRGHLSRLVSRWKGARLRSPYRQGRRADRQRPRRIERARHSSRRQRAPVPGQSRLVA
jgi:hypothetical protein